MKRLVKMNYCGKTCLINLGRKKRTVFVKRKQGEMPKNGHVYNILKLIEIEPASREQISRIFDRHNQLISSAADRGYIIEKNGKFELTKNGIFELKFLESKFRTDF